MLLNRYVLREWAKIFLLALVATLCVLLIEDIQKNLDSFLRWGADAGQIGRYYLFLLPSFLPLVVPLSLLLSLLFALGQLHRNNEIMAMRASGLSLFAITRPLWLSGALIALAMLYVNAELTPASVEATRTLRENLRMADEASRVDARDVGIIHHLGFDNRRDGRLWFMNRFSNYTLEGFGVTVHERDDAGRELRRIQARETYFDQDAQHWHFVEGREINFDPHSGSPIRSLPFDERAYPELNEAPTLMLALSKRAEDLSYHELRELLRRVPPEDNPAMYAHAVRLNSILATPFACLLVVGLAIPFTVTGVRVNPMVGMSKAVGLFFAYYLIANLCRLLGEQRVLDPVIAAWLPIGLMAALALFLLHRAR